MYILHQFWNLWVLWPLTASSIISWRTFIWEGSPLFFKYFFLVSIKHFRKLIFSNWLVPKSHACAIESISGLLMSTIMTNWESQYHHHLPTFTTLAVWHRGWSCWDISSPISDMFCGQDRTWWFMISMQLLYLLLLIICSSKHKISFRTAPDYDITMSTLHWWVQTLKQLCVDFLTYRSWSATQKMQLILRTWRESSPRFESTWGVLSKRFVLAMVVYFFRLQYLNPPSWCLILVVTELIDVPRSAYNSFSRIALF